jgi:hypothetical protein
MILWCLKLKLGLKLLDKVMLKCCQNPELGWKLEFLIIVPNRSFPDNLYQKCFLYSLVCAIKSHGHRVLDLWVMIFLVKRCLAEISGQQHSENGPFAPFYNLNWFDLWISKMWVVTLSSCSQKFGIFGYWFFSYEFLFRTASFYLVGILNSLWGLTCNCIC